jgi:glutaredoxin 3
LNSREPVRAIAYTWSSCSFCSRAKDLLERHGIAFREVVLDGKKEELARLQEAFGARTVPLILLDGERVAGLEALERVLASGPPGDGGNR